MCGGGTTQTSTVSIPPEVLKNYEEVFARAKQVAQKPFVPYSTDPNAFVAGLTPTQEAAIGNINALQGMATPDVREGQGLIRGGIQQGTGLQYRSLGTVQRGQDIGEQLYGRSLGTIDRGQSMGEQLYGRSLGTADIGQAEASNIVRQSLADMAAARGLGQAYASDAARNIYAGMAAADPYMREAAGLTRAGLGAGSQYGGLAGRYLEAGTRGVAPGELAVEQYMSPYTQSVVRAQQALQAEENAAQRAALTGQAIRAGAFGGDRAGIAQANLARQQSLANQATLANLLQSGYGQALQTAQQQQAQELAAAQANRAAQQFGAQQAGTLGQQQYQQALAAAAQQMGLGQALYGQNIGQGQAIQGLGQQQFQQGLGSAQAQAQFGQNLYQMAAQNAQLQQAAAQGVFGQAAQAAALQQQAGQGIFGMSAQNAQLQQAAGNNLFNYGLQGGQGIANLGLANQQAQLQAAQAQMAAGQAQQQTEQAGKTALYNQFTQQQGFPYQQAQFLGNLAMGTGALSGSTTTTQSSGGGFFSDRRMKENVEDVGETYEGQKIYRYNYKGDPRTQIGLMADESKKSAVGSYGGYKTLDYKKATDEAAERGHFYAGGLVPSSMGGAVYEPGAYARGGYAEGGWTKTRDANDEQGRQAEWTNSKTGEVKYGADPNEYAAEKPDNEKALEGIDPRISQFYDKYMFRKPDVEGGQFWQKALESGTPIEEIEKGIAESRERNLVNQAPLTYDPSKFARQAPITRNRYGAYVAPESSFGSSFSPAAIEAQQAQESQAAPQATGKGPAPATQPQRYGAAPSYSSMPSYGYQQPQATGKGPAQGYGGGYGGGYGAPAASYGFGGGGFGAPDFGYGGGYGAPSYSYAAPSFGMGFGGYGAPSYSGFGGYGGYGGFGGYQNPMGNMMAGYNAGYSGPGMTGFMSGYNQGYGNQMGGYGAMGGMPQAAGKGPSASGAGASAFRKGGRVGYAAGGGSHIDPTDLSSIQAQRLMELAPHAAGIPGQTLPGSQTYIPNKLLHVPKLITADVRLPAQKSPYEHAMQTAERVQKFVSMFDDKGILGKEGFIRRNIGNLTTQSENKPGAPASGAASGAPAPAPDAAKKVSMEGGLMPQGGAIQTAALEGEILPPEYADTLLSARGGAIHRNLGGALPYSQIGGGGGYIPQEVLEEPQIRKLPTNDAELRAAAKSATQPSGLTQLAQGVNTADKLGKLGSKGLDKLSTFLGPGGEAAAATGLGTAASEAAAAGLGAGAAEAAGLGAGAAAAGEAAAGLGTLGSLGAAAAEGIGTLLAFLPFIGSDRRLKENVEPIGKLYDGQQVYRYNYKGDDRTQIGLMAQDVEKREKRYAGGLVPQRSGYQEGGVPDEDYAIRTIAAEMSGKSPEEARGIAAVIENRLKSGRWGESYRDVVTARNQFEPWNKPEGPNYPMRFAADSPRMQMAREAFAARGEDPTGGALNFYAPAAQAILAQTKGDRAAVPSWARGRDYTDLGATRFVRDVDAPRPPGLVPAGNLLAKASMSDAQGDAVSQLASRVAAQEAAAAVPATAAARAVDTAKAVAPKEPSKETFVAPKSREGKEQSWSDFLTSRQFIIPALTAIGTMGTTPTRSLGTALSAGLLAGTQSFSDLEKTAEERQLKSREVAATEQRVRTETFTKNMELLDKLRRLRAGYKNRGMEPPPELARQIEAITRQLTESGAGGQLAAGAASLTPEGRQLPAPAAAPATTTTGRVEAKPEEKKAAVEESKAAVPADPAAPKPMPELPKLGQSQGLPPTAMNEEFLKKLDPDFNPVELMRRSKETAEDDATLSEQLAARAMAAQDKMNSTGFGVAIGGGVVPVPGWADEKALQAAAPKLHESFEKQAELYRARQVAKDRLSQIANSLSVLQSGKFSERVNDFVSGMRSAGFDVPDSKFINPTEAQTIAKNAWKTVFDELKAIGGQPRVLEMQGLQQSGANLELDPGANKNILAGALAAFNYEDKFFEDAVKAYKEQGYRYTDAGFMPEWRKNNRLDAMKEEVAKNLAIRGATPTNSNGTINFGKLKDGYTYIIEPGMLPGVTQPSKYRVTKDKDGRPGFERVQ